MKLINQSFEIYKQNPGIQGIYEAIETAGRTCYKSTRPEGKTAKDFVEKLIKMEHYSVLEHGTIYLKIPKEQHIAVNHDIFNNPYTKWKVVDGNAYISTNYRVLYENDWMYLLKYFCGSTKYHEERISVHFITSIGIVRELLRHRKFSFANESTRYCNYSNSNKFGSEITCIRTSETNEDMVDAYIHAEKKYMDLIKKGHSPQIAREVLPLATKSELVMTGFVSDWKDLFNKRSSIAATGKPHPDMIKLIDPLMHEFNKKNYNKE